MALQIVKTCRGFVRSRAKPLDAPRRNFSALPKTTLNSGPPSGAAAILK
jgi:hypothetical protein